MVSIFAAAAIASVLATPLALASSNLASLNLASPELDFLALDSLALHSRNLAPVTPASMTRLRPRRVTARVEVATRGLSAPKLGAQSWVANAPQDEISRLLRLGYEQSEAEADERAIATYQRALRLIESQSPVDSPAGSPANLDLKAEALQGLGTAYYYLGDYERALPALASALALYQDLETQRQPNFDLDQLADSLFADIFIDLLGQLGTIHHEQANFATALGYYRQVLLSDRAEIKAAALHNIGAIETEIAQYDQAERSLAEAVALSQQINDVSLEASSVFTLGWVHERQGNYAAAISSYESAIALFQQTNAPSREARAFNNLAIVHLQQNNLVAARQALDRGFSLLETNDDPYERAVLLTSLGSLYQVSGDADNAWKTQLQALQLSQHTEDTVGEIEVLLNLGSLMEAQKEPALAILFYKEAIANVETIRQDLQQLSQVDQKRYALSVEALYRNLADLLLQQDRAAEALHILDLLKLQEVKAYLRDEHLRDENLRDEHNEAVTASFQLNTLAESALWEYFIRFSQENLLGETLPEETLLPMSLTAFLAQPAVVALREDRQHVTVSDSPTVKAFQEALAVQPIKTAVLYPFILEDRLEIISIMPGDKSSDQASDQSSDQPNGHSSHQIEHVAVSVTSHELSTLVGELQKKLKNKALDPTAAAQQLYTWLIAPVEDRLVSQGVENIIYLPDGVLRYVPLAVLHDGEQWLAQTYQSHNITAAQVDDLVRVDPSPLSLLAGAFTDTALTHQVQIGQQSFFFNGLSAAAQEINNLRAMVPDTKVLLDDAFTLESTLGAVENHRIVHLATHAKFVPGQPEDSFILFGDGTAVTLRDIRQWRLPGVDLVVLSACQTASSFEGEGKEILGLGFQIQQTGAASAIASLWAVEDTATAALMTQFYKALSAGQTKAQALRTAQTALIESDHYSHPYDWAAFILIGNGL